MKLDAFVTPVGQSALQDFITDSTAELAARAEVKAKMQKGGHFGIEKMTVQMENMLLTVFADWLQKHLPSINRLKSGLPTYKAMAHPSGKSIFDPKTFVDDFFKDPNGWAKAITLLEHAEANKNRPLDQISSKEPDLKLHPDSAALVKESLNDILTHAEEHHKFTKYHGLVINNLNWMIAALQSVIRGTKKYPGITVEAAEKWLDAASADMEFRKFRRLTAAGSPSARKSLDPKELTKIVKSATHLNPKKDPTLDQLTKKERDAIGDATDAAIADKEEQEAQVKAAEAAAKRAAAAKKLAEEAEANRRRAGITKTEDPAKLPLADLRSEVVVTPNVPAAPPVPKPAIVPTPIAAPTATAKAGKATKAKAGKGGKGDHDEASTILSDYLETLKLMKVPSEPAKADFVKRVGGFAVAQLGKDRKLVGKPLKMTPLKIAEWLDATVPPSALRRKQIHLLSQQVTLAHAFKDVLLPKIKAKKLEKAWKDRIALIKEWVRVLMNSTNPNMTEFNEWLKTSHAWMTELDAAPTDKEPSKKKAATKKPAAKTKAPAKKPAAKKAAKKPAVAAKAPKAKKTPAKAPAKKTTKVKLPASKTKEKATKGSAKTKKKSK